MSISMYKDKCLKDALRLMEPSGFFLLAVCASKTTVAVHKNRQAAREGCRSELLCHRKTTKPLERCSSEPLCHWKTTKPLERGADLSLGCKFA